MPKYTFSMTIETNYPLTKKRLREYAADEIISGQGAYDPNDFQIMGNILRVEIQNPGTLSKTVRDRRNKGR